MMTFSPRAIEAAVAHVLRELDDRGLLKGVDDDLFAEIGNDVAKAALTAALAVDGVALQGWQPIESAPKDGTWVILYDAEQYHPVHVRNWRTAETNGRLISGWWDEYSQYRPSFRPTHWKPLPHPPAASDREERR